RAAGKLLFYGVSNWRPARVAAALAESRRNSWTGFIVNQLDWSLTPRNRAAMAADKVQMDAENFALHRGSGLMATCYSPQAQGYNVKTLSRSRLSDPVRDGYDNPVNRATVARLGEAADALGVTTSALALAILMRAPFPAIPVIGPRTIDQLKQSMAALT